jgi:hypothetical protein
MFDVSSDVLRVSLSVTCPTHSRCNANRTDKRINLTILNLLSRNSCHCLTFLVWLKQGRSCILTDTDIYGCALASMRFLFECLIKIARSRAASSLSPSSLQPIHTQVEASAELAHAKATLHIKFKMPSKIS